MPTCVARDRSLIASVVTFGLRRHPLPVYPGSTSQPRRIFGNTRSLRIAIANTDEGYKSDLVPLHLNIGDQVVSALRKNESFDWVIATEDEAVEGTRSGEFYAAIVIPRRVFEGHADFLRRGGHERPDDLLR